MSKLFTKAELESIKQRQQGNKLDPTGIFSRRTRPKINELLDEWLPKKEELEALRK